MQRLRYVLPVLLTVSIGVAAGCQRGVRSISGIDPDILAEVRRIPAIDDHAHPVRATGAGAPDHEFDALPVDNMEPSADPLQLRPTDPGVIEAWQTLWNYPYNDASPEHLREWLPHKKR